MQTRYVAAAIFTAAMATVSFGAHAERATGEFSAAKACDAYASFTRQTNPDNLKTAPGTVYPVLEVNRRDAYAWVRVIVGSGEQASPRWVSAECGKVANLQVAQVGAAVGKPPVANMCQTPDKYDSYMLAATWQPGFCNFKIPDRADSKPECVALATGTLKSTNLTLHGLWPNRKECGTNYGHCSAEPLKLKPETVKAIEPWMPNFMFGTSFGAYEWQKHGTCQTALNADGYFLKAVAAIKALNGSRLGDLITQSVGKKVSKADLMNAIKADDSKAVDSVALLCSKGSLYEIRVSLPADFRTDAGLSGLVGANPQPVGNQGEVCPDEGINIAESGQQ